MINKNNELGENYVENKGKKKCNNMSKKLKTIKLRDIMKRRINISFYTKRWCYDWVKKYPNKAKPCFRVWRKSDYGMFKGK